jgi:hypothetical protein
VDSYNERAANDLAINFKDPTKNLFWFERGLGEGGQALLRRALELAGLEYREIRLNLCYSLDLEEIFQSLPDKPGMIILDDYDRTDKFVVDLITFTMLYYEYRKMISDTKDVIYIPSQWKFVIVTQPRAWIPSPPLHKRLCRIA